ncbi:polysaccharide deacetylase [Ancylobacter sp. 6x-1]|uniref:Chitooligosaccharide deacetylase n=1 Tax=Ancylobacter crimeensis TaxID=2579147 RepID=A0ABT0D9L6_9HYPH|nr:polysaccharide deacetylase [Ancylobacter crimeensis]MCK0196632.1 polysaccharide deacetylase [Ancylobacter crimeensis]
MIANPIPWPNGAKCAACLTFDMDADSLIHLAFPDDGHNRVAQVSMLRYGPEVAVPRIVETYRRLGIRQTFYLPAWCMEQYPRAVETILAGGHEIGHHGYIHENPQLAGLEEQAHWLDVSTEVHLRMTGRAPRGWRAPTYRFSSHSLDLLLDRGFAYDASLMGDDLPYLIESRRDGRRLVELPSHWGLDDWPQFVQSGDLGYLMPIRAPSDGWRIYREEFEAAYQHGALWVAVCHPFATGRLARWHEAARFLEEIVARGDVWLAPMEDIAAHLRMLVATGSYAPRIELIPQYQAPIGRPHTPA